MPRYITRLAEQTKFMSNKLRGWRFNIEILLGKVLLKEWKNIVSCRLDYKF